MLESVGGRTPRSMVYDGPFYGWTVEPLIGRLHGFVADHLPPGPRVLDACCGTGGLARRIARGGRTVVGVDLSPSNIAFARQRATARGLTPEQVSFRLGDVSKVVVPAEGRYDVATIVLALHEMPTAGRISVLQRLLQVAETVMVVDYAVPMPWSWAGLQIRAAERAAGGEHFAGFVDYNRRGGLAPLLAKAGAVVRSERSVNANTMQVVCVSTPDRPG